MNVIFENRAEAGRKLAEKLNYFKETKEAVVLAIPRGGVALGFEIAKRLSLPLDIIVVRKIGAPGNPEFAVGAIDQSGRILKNPDVTIPEHYFEAEGKKEKQEIERRIREYKGMLAEPNLKNKTVILVDDGVATGLTTLKAIDFIRSKSPKEIVLAVPVISPDTIKQLTRKVESLIYLIAPSNFLAVGQFFIDFPQVSDEEVKRIMSRKVGAS